MSNKLLEKIDINFHVLDVLDPKSFIVLDDSTWGAIESKPAIIEVKVPGFTEVVTHYYQKLGRVSLNSMSLGLACDACDDLQDIPDGVYVVTVKGSPDRFKKTKSILRTTKLELELNDFLIRNVSTCKDVEDTILKRLNTIDNLIRAAKANLRYGNDCEAFELYQEARKMMDKMKNCGVASTCCSDC